MVLGPPKTAFASAAAARHPNRTTDVAEAIPSHLDDSTARRERFHTRDKSSMDERRGFRESRLLGETETSSATAGRAATEDSDGWTSVRQRRTSGHGNGEALARMRTQESKESGWGSRRHAPERSNRPIPDSGHDRVREADRDGFSRRGGVLRGRNESTWLRKNDGHEDEKPDWNKENVREREKRERDHGRDREWTRGGRTEKEPEWMDTKDRDERHLAHTAEDFQRWKERMKAGSASTEEKSSKTQETETGGNGQAESGTVKQEQKQHTSSTTDTGVDKFFGLWGDPKAKQETNPNHPNPGAKDDGNKGATKKASRFTSFFAPQDTSKQQAEPSTAIPATNNPPPDSKDASSEDKEGFQRILQMLGGASIAAGKPPVAGGRHQPAQVNAQNTTQPPATASPPLPKEVKADGASNIDRSVEHSQDAVGQDGVRHPSSTGHTQAPQSRNNEFLFSLMQHPRVQPEPNPPMVEPFRLAGQMPSFMTGEGLYRRYQGAHPSWMVEAREAAGINGTNGPMPGHFNDPNFLPPQRRLTNEASGPPSSILRAVQKPPGLEHLPAGWPNGSTMPAPQQSQQPPPQPHRQIPPPPGLGNDVNRGSTFLPFISPPPGMPYPPNGMNRIMGPGGINPNMPPPGFFNFLPGPPPGYPAVPFPQEGAMNMPPPPPLPPSSLPPHSQQHPHPPASAPPPGHPTGRLGPGPGPGPVPIPVPVPILPGPPRFGGYGMEGNNGNPTGGGGQGGQPRRLG